jgi:hypothetical protein
MRKRLIGNWRPKRLTAGLAVVFALLIGGGVMAAPAMAATTTTVEHVCEQIGSPDRYGNIGIICSDLLKVDNGNGTYTAEAQTEGVCENSHGAEEQCANVTLYNQAYFEADNTIFYGTEGYAVCGHQNGNCPAPPTRFTLTNTGGVPGNGATCIANAWAVTIADGTSIVLPGSGTPVYPSGNFGTPHASIGNC